MARYTVEFVPSAVKALERLPRAIQQRIVNAVELLADNPFPAGAVKIVGDDSAFRIRVGDYRVLYEVQQQRLIILVLRIGHRKDVYRKGT
jgi:mRNA interferase RelE/StbE